MSNYKPRDRLKKAQWLLVALVAIGLVGCNEDRKLTISGVPMTSLNKGASYRFRPEASDPDGNPLTFSIDNKPVWATFDSATGELKGTPADAHVGTFSNIVIGVTNDTESATLPAFSITVEQASNGSATVSWMPPTENSDGSTLTDLTGYRIYYGTDSASLSQTVEIDNAGLSTYVVENLAPATWHFAMTSLNSKAVESAMTDLVSVAIQ